MEGHGNLERYVKWRKFKSNLILFFTFLTALYGLVWLVWIITDVTIKGFSNLSLDLLLKDPTPPGVEGGGLKHAFVGHLIITSLAVVLGVPIGIAAGVFFTEYGRYSRFVSLLRDLTDSIVSLPSIIVGTFIYAVMVKPVGHFFALSGSVSLALLMLPVIAITTAQMLKMVPDSLREAAYALGAYKWQVIKDVSLSVAKRGILTGVILGIARITGETAPLLFTSFNNNFTTYNIFEPMASLTVTIFVYVMGPYDDWHRKAWAASLILTIGTLMFFILAKILVRAKK
ncbi:phosphate ABC transporter permease PstA [Aquifex aeolicus]|uniref:Phosphate transport system permease protein PstA n=1 Tax=Aquifex aeolicus (strain VF5) TaxID=224324 RepID=O67817_AQUAE|nr:phosphate ABC transporter permease PstA [Aquifex aeolicus]AAC07781.1 phosphate transport system permease PstA [Aquifex aeolicus VF5]